MNEEELEKTREVIKDSDIYEMGIASMLVLMEVSDDLAPRIAEVYANLCSELVANGFEREEAMQLLVAMAGKS